MNYYVNSTLESLYIYIYIYVCVCVRVLFVKKCRIEYRDYYVCGWPINELNSDTVSFPNYSCSCLSIFLLIYSTLSARCSNKSRSHIERWRCGIPSEKSNQSLFSNTHNLSHRFPRWMIRRLYKKLHHKVWRVWSTWSASFLSSQTIMDCSELTDHTVVVCVNHIVVWLHGAATRPSTHRESRWGREKNKNKEEVVSASGGSVREP